MGSRWKAFWKAHDPDDVFSYDTIKLVTIRDRYLGLLHHAFQLGILIYVIGIVIIYQKQFLKREVPTGLVRFVAQDGSASAPPDQGALNYCAKPPAGMNVTCMDHTHDEITTGAGSNLMHLASFYETVQIQKVCNGTGVAACTSVQSAPAYTMVANFQNFEVSIDHSFQTTSGITLGRYTPVGYLKDSKVGKDRTTFGKTIMKFNSQNSDIITIPQILDAINTNLEDNGAAYLNDNVAFREFGMVVLWVVSYSNINNYYTSCSRNKNPCFEYTYQLSRVPSINDYVESNLYTNYPTNRLLFQRRGIRFVGVMSGEIGLFSFQVLLIQLTTSLALIKVATTIVDLIAIRLLPRKTAYKDAKYERTEDFSDKFSKKKQGEKEGAELETIGAGVDN